MLITSMLGVMLSVSAMPLDTSRLSPGDTVYLVWEWGRHPRVIECVVGLGREIPGRPRGLSLGWPEDDGGTAWTQVDATTQVYASRRPAAAVVAAKLRARAAAFLREADEVERQTSPR